MKLRYSFFLFFVSLLTGFNASISRAQIWKNYDCSTKTAAYASFSGSTVVNDNNFLNFTGTFDVDNGVTDDILTGFTFDYNGNTYNSVNICVNGWATVGHISIIPTITSNQVNLFTPNSPNNVLAPLWGDHVDRLVFESSHGYKPSIINFLTTVKADTDPEAVSGSFIHTFIVEWKDMNINDKADVNSTATFELWIVENPKANNVNNPDHRAQIEFHYGSVGSTGTLNAANCTVGISDSTGTSFMNGLYSSSFAGGDSTRLSTTQTSSCWPPTCTPNSVIVFSPKNVTSGVLSSAGLSDIGLMNFPNPFNLSTKIRFQLPEESFITLKVYDFCGREVASALSGHQPAGNCEVNFDGSALPSGIYEYRLKTNTFTEIRKMNLIK